MRATFFCKVAPSVARVTTFVINLSHSKIRCCKSANSNFIGQSCVNKDGAFFHKVKRFDELPLGLLTTTGLHFLLDFPCQRNSLSMKLGAVSEQNEDSCDNSSKPFTFLTACFKGTNEVLQKL